MVLITSRLSGEADGLWQRPTCCPSTKERLRATATGRPGNHRATAYGDILSYTVASLTGEIDRAAADQQNVLAAWASRALCAGFSDCLALRPSQVKAFAEDAA